MKSPGSRKCVGGFFDIGDFTPTAVMQKRMSKFVRDDVFRECFSRRLQLWPQYDAATSLARGPRCWHEKCPPPPRFVVFDSGTESRVIHEVTLHFLGQRLQHR